MNISWKSSSMIATQALWQRKNIFFFHLFKPMCNVDKFIFLLLCRLSNLCSVWGAANMNNQWSHVTWGQQQDLSESYRCAVFASKKEQQTAWNAWFRELHILLLSAADETGVVRIVWLHPHWLIRPSESPHFTAGWNFARTNLAVCRQPGQGQGCIYVPRV